MGESHKKSVTLADLQLGQTLATDRIEMAIEDNSRRCEIYTERQTRDIKDAIRSAYRPSTGVIPTSNDYTAELSRIRAILETIKFCGILGLLFFCVLMAMLGSINKMIHNYMEANGYGQNTSAEEEASSQMTDQSNQPQSSDEPLPENTNP